MWRHSWRPIGSRPARVQAAFARLRTFDGVNGCAALVPKTRPPRRPERSLCSTRCSRRTRGDRDRSARRRGSSARSTPSFSSQERSTRITPAARSTSSQRSASSSPRRRPRVERGRPERAVALRQRGEERFAPRPARRSARVGPRPPAARGRVVGLTATSPRAIARRKITRSGMSVLRTVVASSPSAQSRSAKSWTSTRRSLREPRAAELGEHARRERRLVAADRRRLVDVAAAVPDRAAAHAREPGLGGFAQRGRRPDAHRAAAERRSARRRATPSRCRERRERLVRRACPRGRSRRSPGTSACSCSGRRCASGRACRDGPGCRRSSGSRREA